MDDSGKEKSSLTSNSSAGVDGSGSIRKSGRRCMFGCTDGSAVLCRFPVQDPQRCQDWIDFFRVSEKHIRETSLVNLRVCMKHFKEKITMVNGKVTRHLSVDSAKSSKGTKRSRQYSSSSSIWNGSSDCSVASPANSDDTCDYEPRSKRSSVSEKLPITDFNSSNSKLFVITQSAPSDGTKMTEDGQPVAQTPQKKKLFLILENIEGTNGEPSKHQKITLIAGKSDAKTAAQIEPLLPQLIQQIQNGNVKEKSPSKSMLMFDSEDDQSQPSINEEKTELPIQIQRVETLANIAPPIEQKAVNLSSDFLFLMKMVPKLEAISEPVKTHIKDRIERLLTEPVHEIAYENIYGQKVKTSTTAH